MANINDVISDNLGLVYKQLHRFKLVDNPDAESFAYEALYKAVQTYDSAKGNAFSTYATCVISNTLRMYLRTTKKKRTITVLSYDEPLQDSENHCFLDVLAGPNNAEDTVLYNELQERIRDALYKVYSDLSSDKHRAVFELWYKSNFKLAQREISERTGISQPMVSRILGIIKYKLRQELEDYL